MRTQDLIAQLYAEGKLCDCYEVHKVYKPNDKRWAYAEITHKRNCKGRWRAMDFLQELASVKVQPK